MIDVSVVVPTRNAEELVIRCLASIQANLPTEIIVVDGLSTDSTIELATELSTKILSDEGRGVAWARHLGAEEAKCRYVAFIDVDIELPENALEKLLDEMLRRDAHAIQAGLISVDSGDYWSRALSDHYNHGRSRNWFGLSCTLFEREFFLRHDLDPTFKTGEDIELRHRLQAAGEKTIISSGVTVPHRFEKGLKFALNQWLMDGAGLGRMIRKFNWKNLGLVFMPAGGMLLGFTRSFRNKGQFIPYYVLYMVFNYAGMTKALIQPGKSDDVSG